MKKRKRSKSKAWIRPDGRHATSFLVNLEEIQKEVIVTNSKKKTLSLTNGFSEAIKRIIQVNKTGSKMMFIGNGGSAAIASHQAVDFSKNGGVEAMAFNDASLLTCFGNDCGYENVFAKPVERYAKPGDLLIAISSSGKSPNILNGVKAARAAKCHVITFSGFMATNPLRKTGDLNFYVPTRGYGLVEVSHLALIHAILREVIYINPNVDKRLY